MSKDRTTWIVVILGFAVGVPLLYFLSAGPMSRIYPHPPRALDRFYEPLDWVYNNTPLSGVMEWYMNLWSPELPTSLVPKQKGKPN